MSLRQRCCYLTSSISVNPKSAAAVAIIFAAAVALYWPLLWVGLLSDDWGIASGPFPIRALVDSWFPGPGPGGFYRPLARIGIWAQVAIFGTNGIVPHLISFALFFGTIALAAATLIRLGYPVAAGVAAVFITFHPANVETVGWIASQTDLFFGFFFALTIFALTPPLSKSRLYWSLGAAVLAYLSKDTAIILGPMILLICACGWFFPDSPTARNRQWIVTGAAHLTLYLVYLLMRVAFVGHVFPADSPAGILDTPLHQTVNFTSMLHEYFGTLVPWFAPRASYQKFNPPTVWLWVFVLSVPALLYWNMRRIAAVVFLLLLMASVPAILTPHPHFYNSFQGGRRYLYHPIFLLAPILGLLFESSLRQAKRIGATGVALFAGVIIAYGFETAHRITSFTRAAAVRDRLQTELEQVFQIEQSPRIHVVNLPLQIEGAYIFQNGLEEYLARRYPDRGKIIAYSDMSAADVAAARGRSYNLIYRGEDEWPILTPATEFNQGLANISARMTAGRAARERPLEINFAREGFPANRISLSPSVQLKGVRRGEAIFSFDGSGYIDLQIDPGKDSLEFAHIQITGRFPSEEGKPERRIPMRLEWQPVSVNPYKIGKDFTVPSRSTFETTAFDLSTHPGYAGFPSIQTIRLLFPEFKGELAISKIVLGPAK